MIDRARLVQPRLSWPARYLLRLKRKYLLWRARKAAKQLTVLKDCTAAINASSLLCFATMRNERQRLPYYLEHYRRLGITQFLIVDNDSDDGTREYLLDQPDVSLWTTDAPYRSSRFGVDWLTGLQHRYGRGIWCLTADADEILIYPEWQGRDLHALTAWLDEQGQRAFGAMMLDMYPKGSLGGQPQANAITPFDTLRWFDADTYTWDYKKRYGQISIRGGPRKRVFFQDEPDHAPHLHKTPLVRWARGDVYVSSTHTLLPRYLNAVFDARLECPTGVLLHTKFLDEIIAKSEEEKVRRQHFTYVERYERYYDEIIAAPDLWCDASQRYANAQQLEQLGLMRRGAWP
ncbi:Glycosyl transferase family 2 [Epibacterium ulvae]|uniref:Glycosyl transferase family 2 n=1 Tax=Epibacterium ulvae TaxID=1156985 RepID=A0A1G5R7L3_9RHOB|nr:Glycosyl transferase family 2 [Epibacterium ulvae]